jgi:hypothetical protein
MATTDKLKKPTWVTDPNDPVVSSNLQTWTVSQTIPTPKVWTSTTPSLWWIPVNTELVNGKTPDLWVPIWWTTPSTQTVAKETVSLPVDNTKPHTAWDVWNWQTWNWELPWTTTNQNANVDSIIKWIDPQGTMSADEKAEINKIFSNQDPTEQLKLAAMTAEQKAQLAQQTLQASRLKRDTEQKLSYDQQQYNLQKSQYEQQMNTQIENQKNNIDATANNLSVVAWTSWRLMSQNAANAAKTALDQQKTLYNNMISTRDNALQQMANSFNYSNKQISDNYNDQVNKSMQDALSKIEALNKTGSLNTNEWLIQARDYLDTVNSDYLEHTTNYANQLNLLHTMYTDQMAQQKEMKTVDAAVTKQMNDWYVYNAQWGIISGSDWQPLQYDIKKQIKDTFTDNNGDVTILYEDWTFSAPQKWIGKKEVEKPTYQDLWDKIVAVDSTGKVIWTYAKWSEQMSEYQRWQLWISQAELWIKQQELKASQWAQLVQSNPQSIAEFSATKRGTTNLQCWQLVNDYIQQITWTKWSIWDTYQSKVNALKTIWESDTPQVWWIFVYWNSKSKYWHTWIIQSIDGNKITVLDANRAASAKWGAPEINTYTIDKNYKFSQPIQSQKNTTVNPDLAPLYAKYNKWQFSWTDWSNLWISKSDFIAQAWKYKDSLSSEWTQQIKKLIDLAKQLKTDKGRTWAALGVWNVPFTDAADYQAKFDAFISSNALDNLVDLKSQWATFWALSDQELKFIKNASTSLKLWMSDKAYNAELDRIIEKLSKWLSWTDTQSTPKSNIKDRLLQLRQK